MKKTIRRVVVHYSDGTDRSLSLSEIREHFPGHFVYRKSRKVQRILAAQKPRVRKLKPSDIESAKAEYAERVREGTLWHLQ